MSNIFIFYYSVVTMMFIVYFIFYMDFSVSGVDIVTVSLLNIPRPTAHSVLFSTLFKGSIVIFSSVGNIDVPMYLLNISFFIYNIKRKDVNK